MSTTDDPIANLDGDEEPAVLGAGDTVEYVRARSRRESRQLRRAAKKAHHAAPKAEGDEIVTVYESHVRYVPPLRPYMRDLWDRRAFAVEMARSKVKGSRSNTALGGLWALLDPMFMVGIYYFLFTVVREGARPTTFLPLLISGILHFQLSSTALNEGGQSVTGASNLMLNSTFPRMLLPLASVYGGVLKFLPSIVIIFFSLLLLDAEVTFQLLWWFPLFTLQVMIGLGLALIVSTAVVFFADVKNLLTYVSRIMFFTAPVIYPIDFLPENIFNAIQWTPLFGVFASYQAILVGDAPASKQLLIASGWAIGSVVFGAWLFLRHEREFGSRV